MFHKINISIHKLHAKILKHKKEVLKLGKLYSKYTKLKQENPEIAYAFKVGIFYIFIDEDAKYINSILGLKLTPLNDTIFKCGFPVSKLSKYTKLMEENKIKFNLVDNNLSVVTDTEDYVNNSEIENIISTIKKLDIEHTSPMEAFNMLIEFKNILNRLE